MHRWVRHWLTVVIAIGISGCATAGLEHNNAGLRYIQERDPARAEGEFRQAVAANAENDMFYNNLGVALFQQQRYDEAAAAYRRAIELKADDALPHANLGDVYYALGDTEAAHRSYRQAIDLATYRGSAYLTFVLTALDRGTLRDAMVYLEGLLQTATPSDPESVNKFFLPRLALAHAHLLQGNPGETRKYVSGGLDVLGQVKTVKGGYSFPIITPFSFSLVTVPPTRFNVNGVYAAFYQVEGLAQFAVADYDGAAESFRKRIYKSPDYVPYLQLGRVALEKDDLQEALRHFRTSLDKQATDIARLYYSAVLKLSGDETAAQAQYEQAVNSANRRNLTAKSHYAYFEALGRAHQAWGRLDEAAAAYVRVVEAVPSLGYGHRQLGEVYRRQGNQAAAVSHLQEAQRLMPDDARTIMLLKEVSE